MKTRPGIDRSPYIFFVLALLLGTFSFQLWAQTAYKVDGTATALTISGTSSLHDWDLTAGTIQGKGTIRVEGKKIVDVRDLELNVPVEGLKSGKGAMDKNTYKALNSDEHPVIKYRLVKVTGQEGNTLFTSGVLEVAGVSKPIDLQVNYSVISVQKIQIRGQVRLNMTDFNVDPPVALLGTIKTGDQITATFEVNLLL